MAEGIRAVTGMNSWTKIIIDFGGCNCKTVSAKCNANEWNGELVDIR